MGFRQSLRAYASRRHRIAELLLIAGLGTAIVAFPVDPAVAACSLSTTTETCTDNISAGVSFTAPTVKTLDANSLTANVAPASGTPGLSLTSVGGNGGGGSNGAAGIGATGGGPGQPADNLTINYSQPGANSTLPNSGAIVTINAAGIVVTSTGGNGGTGGSDFIGGNGASGGDGGSGGNVTVNAQGAIATSGPSASGIVALSSGGNGGTGGSVDISVGGSAGAGGHGGPAGTVTVGLDGRIITNGTDSNGIFAVSRGGAGGSSGNCAALFCGSGSAGDAALGGTVTVTTTASSSIETFASFSNGIYAASIGGFAGGGGGSGGIVSFGSNGASAGDGGAVNVNNAGTIITHGVSSYGIFAQSVGGGGGGGGSSGGLVSIGGSGSSGGAGGTVDVINSGAIATLADKSIGIYAQSIGGAGGDGGNSGGIVSVGGNGSVTSPGGNVTVTNSGAIQTFGNSAQAIFAQSIGGGGGNGGTSFGVVTIGGSGGGGGKGGVVEVDNSASLSTRGADSSALFAQSIGGGGGNGGGSYALGPGFSLAIGGSGSTGSNGDAVTVNQTTDVNTLTAVTITTTGDRSHGIQAQSIGGGGGNGGLAFAGSIGVNTPSASVALGGSGAGGGSAGDVTVNEKGNIVTVGQQAYGIMAQSVGGGGGNGGGSISVSGGTGEFSLGFAMGGTAGPGGSAGSVTVNAVGTITTTGSLSYGIFAQSVGGGGGNGGYAVAASGGALAGSIALGGAAGVGGSGADVIVNASGAGFANAMIYTQGTGSAGIFAQSVGGGGGNGGFAGTLGVGGAAASLGLGGAGAGGAIGGSVTVTNANRIITIGAEASGIFAQSIGGGGGNGGFALSGSGGAFSAAATVGGSGGAGSDGGAVAVSNSGDIFTSGAQSYGILAQSVGGGGGNGGFAISGAVGISVDGNPGGAAAIAIGGTGGGASDGNLVTVTNTGNILTTGDGAHAIFAQSVGGGGGSGGFAGSLAMTIGTGASFGVSIGGSASGGGNGEAVVVQNLAGSLVTYGAGAQGVLAQSVGGGGGDGGFAFAGAFGFGGEKNVNVSVAVGGAGGAGGTGGTVTVTNQSIITTVGTQSNGILAQSIGGSGGNGGMAISGTLGLAETAGSVGVTVGGYGGSGSFADQVTVTNSGAITTFGSNSIGIFGQSIGGSGGNGGLALTAQLTGATKTQAAIGLAVGGGGGDGNSAGEVDITNTAGGSILTRGFGAHGIEAQSIGGGGGNGGMAIVAQVGVAGGTEEDASKTLTVGVSVGGGGGSGGFGNTVRVTNDGAISVSGDTAVGIFAQSVGGGGGDGGGSLNALGMLTDSTNNDSRSVNVNVTIGGGAGNGSYGGTVIVNNTGSITTTGVSGYGIFAQSVGGGGGIGGRANTFALVVTDACTLPLLCNAPASTKNNMQLGVTVGGSGGTASTGGTVTVTNSGRITTFGNSSDGIFAQSVGGGGGAGGNGILGSGSILPVPVELAFVPIGSVPFYKNVQIAVGGNNGSSGDGGTVTVDNYNSITTFGANSNGILAQSIGGGGGIGGNAVTGLTGTIGIGGKGGASGNGGDVTVTQHGGGLIETFGVASNGIFAQSVGGGGGVAGNVDRALASNISTPIPGFTIPGFNVGIGLALGQGGGNGGNGGAVTVTVDGAIVTHGDSAAGIFAQSVGGGGGVLGELGNALPGLNLLSWAIGSNGDAGNSGVVTVTMNGTIVTAGNNATGIFAQSAAGSGGATAGPVNVTVNGSVISGGIYGAGDGTAASPLRGRGSIGIYAQSVAVDDTKNGDITINLNSSTGLVLGGRTVMLDSTHGYIGVGVWMQDGKNNTINNHGLITTLGGTGAGFAILANGSDPLNGHAGGNNTVNNFGTVAGSFDLGTMTNSFNNLTGSALYTGSVANVGAGNTLTNAGIVNIGGTGTVMTTTLAGNYVQTTTGTYAVDVRFGSTPSDLMNVSGTADVRGQVSPHLVALAPGAPVTILDATGGLIGAKDATTVNTPIVSYGLQYNGNNLQIGIQSVNFLTPSFVGGLTTNQINTADHFQNVWNTGVPSALAPAMGYLANITNAAAYAAALDQLHPASYLPQLTGAIMTGSAFLDGMMSCRAAYGTLAALREHECVWARFTGGVTNQKADGNNFNYRETAERYQVGVQTQAAANSWRGFAVSFESARTSSGNFTTTEAQRGDVGVSVKHQIGNWLLAAAFETGVATLDTRRAIPLAGNGTVASSSAAIWHADARFRAVYLMEMQNLYLKPSIDVDLIQAWMPAFSEHGAGPLDLQVNALSRAFAVFTPALEAGATFRALDGATTVRPFVAGAASFFTDNQWSLMSTFEGTPTGVNPFNTVSTFPKTLFKASAGVDLISSKPTGGLDVRLVYDGLFGEKFQSHTGSLKASVRF